MRTGLLCKGILASWLLVLGCQRQPDPTLPTYSLRLADRRTGDPVVGARVRPYCGIPADANDYRTDIQGSVVFRSWFVAGGTMVKVPAEGYLPTNFFFPLPKLPTTLLLYKVP